MYKSNLILIFLIQLVNCIAQTEYQLPYNDTGDKRFTFIDSGFEDPNDDSENAIYQYDSGIVFSKVFLSDSSWIDSVLRYNENGDIAYRGWNLRYNPIYSVSQQQINQMPDYYVKSYYENNSIRSIEKLGYTDSTFYFLTRYYDLNTELIYEEIYLHGDTVKGTFYKNSLVVDSINTVSYVVYENQKLIETWKFNDDHPEGSFIVLDIVLHNSKKTLSRKRELKKKLKKTPIVRFSGQLVVVNGKGRKWSTDKIVDFKDVEMRINF
jgi:hypothetical protein